MHLILAIQILGFTPRTIHQIEYFSHSDNAPREMVALEEPVLPLQERKTALTRTVYGFLPYWQRSQYVHIRWDLITHVVPFGVEINGSGDIVNYHGWPSYWSGVIDSAHAHGVRVHLAVILFNSDAIHTLITSPTNTANAIANLLNAVNAGGVEGVNIDFEIPPSSDRDALTAFMQALADTFHNHNLEVTMDLMAVDDAWSDRYDQAALASFLDGLMIMSYDYFYPGSDHAGPPSPLTGYTYNFTRSMNHYSSTTGRPEKIIMGVPYYGYDWPTVDSTRGSRTRGQASAVFYASAAVNASIYGRIWDSFSQTPWYRYNSDGWHQCWYDDDSSLTLKYQAVNSTSVQGIGIWALTYDGTRPELWYALLANFAEPWDVPGEVTHLKADPILNGRIRLSWTPVENAARYRVYMSTDGESYQLISTAYSTILMFGGLDTSTVYFYRIQPVNPWHEGELSEVVAVRPSARTLPQVMMVNATSDPNALIPYARTLAERNLYFGTVSEDVVEDSGVVLAWYRAVVWVSGDSGDSTPVMTPAAEAILSDFVSSGGNLLISGSNVASSLASTGDPSDSAFLHDVLGVEFVTDDATDGYSFEGVLPQVAGTYNFDDGTHGHYDVADPDGVRAVDGALTAFVFSGTDTSAVGVAGVLRGDNVVFVTVPLETVYPDDSLNLLLHRIFDIFGVTAVHESDEVAVPASLLRLPSTVINGELRLVPNVRKPLSFQIMDASGRLIGRGFLSHGSPVTVRLPKSGVYFVRVTDGQTEEIDRVVNVR